MIGSVTPNLPARLLGYLRPGAPALLLTAGADGYATSAYTWVVALDDKCVRFGVDDGGSAMATHNAPAWCHCRSSVPTMSAF
jgi:hypothetical protein